MIVVSTASYFPGRYCRTNVNLSTAMDIHANFHENIFEMEKKYHQIAKISMLFQLNMEHNEEL